MKADGFAVINDLAASMQFAAVPAGSPFTDGGWVQLAKTGVFFSPVYGRIEITPDDLANMVANFQAAGTELPWDYDHLSDEPQKPGDGKAAGWIQALETRDDGQTLWARSKWTKTAAQMISNGEYRFTSPFFLTNMKSKETGKKIGPTLRAAALTNRPFLEGMQPIPAPAIAASDRLARLFGHDPRVAVPRAYRLGQQAIRAHQKGESMKTCAHCGAPAERDGKAIARAEETAGTITCPHCGAPVKYAVEAPPDGQEDADPPVPPAAPEQLDEGGGDADALEELAHKPPVPPGHKPPTPPVPKPAAPPPAAEMEDAPAAEMMEPATGPKQESTAATASAAKEMAEDQPETPKPAVGTSMREVESLRTQVRQLAEKNAITEATLKEVQRRERRENATRLTQRALKEGKATPKMVGTWERPGWALAEAYNRPRAFVHWLENTAPVVVDFSERGSGSGPDAASEAVGLAEQMDKAARTIMAAKPGLAYADAMRQANTENRALAERYDQAMSAPADGRTFTEVRTAVKP